MENKFEMYPFWQLWMMLSLFSALLFPFSGIIAAVKMNNVRKAPEGTAASQFAAAKRWTILTYVLFAVCYVVILIALSIHFIHLLS